MTRALPSLLFASLTLCACARHEASPVIAHDLPPPSPASSLPRIKSGVAVTSARFSIVLDAKSLQFDGAVIVPRSSDPTRGFDAQYKRSGANDLYVMPLAAALDHARGGNDAGENDGARLDLVGDATYRELVEIAFTLGQNAVKSFRLVAPSAGGEVPAGTLAQIEIFPPHARPYRAPTDASTLNLVVILGHAGISVKARGGNIAPGCTDAGPGLTLSNTDAGYEFAPLTDCLARVKAAAPEFADETSAVLAAGPDVLFRDVIVAIDTERGAHRELFPDVQLGLAQ